MKFDRKRIPLTVIGGIFILLIIMVNVSLRDIGKSTSEKLCNGVNKLINDDYNISGEITIKSKGEDISIIDDISFLYDGIVSNADNRIRLNISINANNLGIDKELGDIYKINNRIVFAPIVEENSYYYDLFSEEINNKLDINRVEQTLDGLHDIIIDEGMKPITINGSSKKIMTNKITININNEDINKVITTKAKNDFIDKKLLNTLTEEEFRININTYIDNRDYVKKIEIILENNDYRILSINCIENYNEVSEISIEDILDNKLDVEDIEEGDILRIISNMFDIGAL
ncbi:hypothetical protein AN1V17_20610 [Vallitalea sediminicola]